MKKLTIVVLRNADYGVPGPGKITQDLAAILFGEKYEIPAAVVSQSRSEVLDAYVGQYQLAPNFVLTISKEGDLLMAQATGQPKITLYAQAEAVFFSKAVDLRMTFVKGDDGKVTHLILNQGGDRQAKRIN